MATNEETPITAVEAAVAPETIDTPAAAETTGTTSLVDDIAMAASAVTSAAPTPGTATGTATPFELDEHQRRNSLNVSLADMCAKATALFAQKKFDEAADTYSRATEMQAEMNGEMNPENAEILFLYGRAVFEVGRSKSDVLGNAPAAGKEDAKKPNNKKAGGAKKATEAAEGASAAGVEPEKIIEKAVAGAAGEATPAKTEDAAKNPLLQFEGDEGYDDSDEEMDDEEGDGEEEEDDDFDIAFQTLDLARVLFTKKLEAEQQNPDTEDSKGKEVSEGDSPAVKHIKERLADAHDLLAEISLENEKYHDAIKDLRSSLKYKQELFPDESGIIAECHYKLSLALEFASVTHASDDKNTAPEEVDENLREEAANEMQAAIDCTKAKLQGQEVELATMHSPEDNDITKNQISEARELIADMEQRLIELKNPPIDLNAEVNAAAKNALGGLFGNAAGGSAAEIEAAKKTATDLSGLVRKKAKDEPKETNGSAKRKAEESADAEAATESKKPKIDEPAA